MAAFAAFAASAAEPANSGLLAEAGKRIYREGRVSSGKAVRAAMPGGMPLTSQAAACANCHRRSGMGAVEGVLRIPALIPEILYRPGWETRRFGHDFPRRAQRPAYDRSSLANAIRHGFDSGGRRIQTPMPRYELNDRDMASLIAYLDSLRIDAAPGVDDGEIHFATVLTDGVPPARRRAVQEVLAAYFEERNGEPRAANGGKDAPAPKRRWRLHVWELSGPRESWPGQLDRHYRRRPVFAGLSGSVAGTWQPVHDFCEKMQLPWLFPSTDLPAAADANSYSIYFSRGVATEAQALAAYLRESPPAGPVLQVYAAHDAVAAAAAAAFSMALSGFGMRQPEDLAIREAPDAAFWNRALSGKTGVTVVTWLDAPEFELLRPWIALLERVMFSSRSTGGLPDMPTGFDGKLTVVHPFALPERQGEAWPGRGSGTGAAGWSMDEARVRAEARFAATAATAAVMGIGRRFSRDYFLEQTEYLPEHMAALSVYPRLSLGRGQRFAAKGAHVLTLAADGVPRIHGWFVP